MTGREITKHDFWIARLRSDPRGYAMLGPYISGSREVTATRTVMDALRADTAVDLMRSLGAQYEKHVPVHCAVTLSVQSDAAAWPSEKAAWGDGYSDEVPEAPPPPPVDSSAQQLTTGEAVPADRSHTKLRPDGQQEGYVVLSADERAKGFVRPFRDAYRHVGVRPIHPTRELTAEERERYAEFGYVSFEAYPESESAVTGRYWTEAQLNAGCGKITTMGRSIAETYARDPLFYSGTFCTHCRGHFPVGEGGEFTWYEMDGREGPKVGT